MIFVEVNMTKGRLEAFSDGVIAIIITITILEIGLPNGNDMRALLEIMPLVRSNEKVTSGIVAINAWKAHFKKFR